MYIFVFLKMTCNVLLLVMMFIVVAEMGCAEHGWLFSPTQSVNQSCLI